MAKTTDKEFMQRFIKQKIQFSKLHSKASNAELNILLPLEQAVRLVQIAEKAIESSHRPVFPAQPNNEGGWTILFAYLQEVAVAITASSEDSDYVSLEAIEAVLLAVGDVEEKGEEEREHNE